MAISNTMTVIGLTNGMIGGIILVMPLLALRTGWLLIAPLTMISGFFSYFACLLCLRHLRDYKNLDVAIYHHFGKKNAYKIGYDIIIIISMTVLLVLYFSLICEQWAGIVGPSKIISIVNALALFPIVYIMKKFDFGASLLAYGILSVVGYVLFLTWLWFTTEPGPKQVSATHQSFVDLAAALAQGFAIQTFFIPILKKNPNRKLYKKLLGITYILGSLVYCFIGYSGAFSLVNREPAVVPEETIEDYFPSGTSWQVILVEIIYLVHLYSAFPEFLLIANIFKFPETKDVNIKQVIYTGATILICLLLKLTEIKVTIIIELNGSIISFFFIYVIPIGLHLKCVYFTKVEERHAMLNEEKQKDPQDMDKTEDEEDEAVQDEEGRQSVGAYSGDGNRKDREIQLKQVQMKFQEDKSGTSEKEAAESSTPKEEPNEQKKEQTLRASQLSGNIQNDSEKIIKHCTACDIRFSSRVHEYCELFAMGTMVIVGLLTMGYTLYLLIQGDEEI